MQNRRRQISEERGARKRDKRARLAENNRPVSDGVTRRTKRRRGKITFNDMLSVEASLRLRSATEGGKKRHDGDLQMHVPSTHTHAHTEQHGCGILITSSTMPNNCSHSKVPKNHRREFHPLGYLCVCLRLWNRPCSASRHCVTGFSPVHS